MGSALLVRKASVRACSSSQSSSLLARTSFSGKAMWGRCCYLYSILSFPVRPCRIVGHHGGFVYVRISKLGLQNGTVVDKEDYRSGSSLASVFPYPVAIRPLVSIWRRYHADGRR